MARAILRLGRTGLRLDGTAFIGELVLDGSVRQVTVDRSGHAANEVCSGAGGHLSEPLLDRETTLISSDPGRGRSTMQALVPSMTE